MRLLDALGVKKASRRDRRVHRRVSLPAAGHALPGPRADRRPDRHGRRRRPSTSASSTSSRSRAIEGDPHFKGGDYYDGPRPDTGLALARRIAHKTFVSLDSLARARAQRGGQPQAAARLVRDEPPRGVLHAPPGESSCSASTPTPTCASWTPGSGSTWPPRRARTICTRRLRAAGTRSSSCSAWTPTVSFHPHEQAKLVHLLKQAHVPAMWITVHYRQGPRRLPARTAPLHAAPGPGVESSAPLV